MDPSIRSDYAAAAGRFGHSMIQNFYTLWETRTSSEEDTFALKDAFFNNTAYEANGGR